MNPHRLGSAACGLMAAGLMLMSLWNLPSIVSGPFDPWDLIPWSFPFGCGLAILVIRSWLCTMLFGEREEIATAFPELELFWRGMIGVLGLWLVATHLPRLLSGEQDLPYSFLFFGLRGVEETKPQGLIELVLLGFGVLLIVEGGRLSRFWCARVEEEGR